MINKKERTLDAYLIAGAKLRMAKTVFADALTEVAKVIPSKDVDSMLRVIEKKFGHVSSVAENQMFGDFPNLSNDYLCVFYGDASVNPRNMVDEHVVELMRDYTGGIKIGKTAGE